MYRRSLQGAWQQRLCRTLSTSQRRAGLRALMPSVVLSTTGPREVGDRPASRFWEVAKPRTLRWALFHAPPFPRRSSAHRGWRKPAKFQVDLVHLSRTNLVGFFSVSLLRVNLFWKKSFEEADRVELRAMMRMLYSFPRHEWPSGPQNVSIQALGWIFNVFLVLFF